MVLLCYLIGLNLSRHAFRLSGQVFSYVVKVAGENFSQSVNKYRYVTTSSVKSISVTSQKTHHVFYITESYIRFLSSFTAEDSKSQYFKGLSI